MTDLNLTPAALLTKAAAYVDRGWTQGALARDADGLRYTVYPIDPDATCWCAMGAIQAAARCTCFTEAAGPRERAALDALGVLAEWLLDHKADEITCDDDALATVGAWNDEEGRTQAEVAAALRAAAALPTAQFNDGEAELNHVLDSIAAGLDRPGAPQP